MNVLNLFGGPGCGKSTAAAAVFAYFKNRGMRCELTGEVAKTVIYEGRAHLLSSGGNQLLILALQYERLKELERAGCEYAISDSPIVMQLAYASSFSYFPELVAIIEKLTLEFTNINVFIRRTKPYDPFARTQKTVEEAREKDAAIRQLTRTVGLAFDYEVHGDELGQRALGELLCTRFHVTQPAPSVSGCIDGRLIQ